MKKLIPLILLMALLPGCVLYESVVYVQRMPITPQVEAQPRPDKPDKWYVALAQSVVGLVPSILREVRLLITDTASTITGGVVDVKKNTVLEKITFRRFFATGDADVILDKHNGIIKQENK